MIDFTGKHLGHYRLERLLGTGGFADVYLGTHIHLNTQAAVKILHARLRAEGMKQFRNEAHAIARLKHPHIVRMLDFGVEKGQIPYLVMDYIPYGTLRQRYARGVPLPLPIISLYTRQVAEALQYAHNHRYIHRDVKPDNILLEEDSHILLSDFSLAVVAHDTNSQTTQQIAGTIMYMAPEQIEGYPRPASDQYSLGVMVYEWLCGQPPFSGTLLEMITKHCSVPPPPLRAHNPSIPPAVEQVVLRALEKDWHARFPTIQEFALALEQAACASTREYTAQSIQPVRPLASVKSHPYIPATSRPLSHLPIINVLSARQQILWMLGYLLLTLVYWIPYFAGFLADITRGTSDTTLPLPILIYMLLFLFFVPASVSLAGSIFGALRGSLVSMLYTGIIGFLLATPPLFLGENASRNTIIFYAIILGTWPLASLVVGIFSQRRIERSFGDTYATMILGTGIMILGWVPLLLIDGTAAMPSTNIAISYMLFLIIAPIVACLLALPLAALETLLQLSIERVRKCRAYKKTSIVRSEEENAEPEHAIPTSHTIII